MKLMTPTLQRIHKCKQFTLMRGIIALRRAELTDGTCNETQCTGFIFLRLGCSKGNVAGINVENERLRRVRVSQSNLSQKSVLKILKGIFAGQHPNAKVDLCEEAKSLALLSVENEEQNVDRIRRVQGNFERP